MSQQQPLSIPVNTAATNTGFNNESNESNNNNIKLKESGKWNLINYYLENSINFIFFKVKAESTRLDAESLNNDQIETAVKTPSQPNNNSAPSSLNYSFNSNINPSTVGSTTTTKSKLNPFAMEFNPTFGTSNLSMIQSPSSSLLPNTTTTAVNAANLQNNQVIPLVSQTPFPLPVHHQHQQQQHHHQIGPTTQLVVATGTPTGLPHGAVPLSAISYSTQSINQQFNK